MTDLNRHTCSCGNDTIIIVCSRAIVASCHSNIHELFDLVQIYYRTDVLRTTYLTNIVHPLPLYLNGNIRPFNGCFIAYVIAINYVNP
uniref:Uncharacterized protein n=1 Tax=Lactuca sativa TaxID=4236 RepID=A0A9R1VWV6_LACSA|nr:hypothetical protein LSAT_V11C400210080 [Lactuca sativa]